MPEAGSFETAEPEPTGAAVPTPPPEPAAAVEPKAAAEPKAPVEPPAVESKAAEPDPSAESLEAGPDALAPKPRRRRRGRILIAFAAVIALLLGVGAASAVYYYDSVKAPDEVTFPSNTVLYYADGTVLARLGQVQRTAVSYDNLIPEVGQAAVAAEDPDFWTDSGGPIARSVARISYDLTGDSTSVRLRTAVLARKLEDNYSKEEVLAMYLNAAPFGRLTYGIEAAAREYFGKTADKGVTNVPRLSMSEAIVLLAMPRQPEANPDAPQGSPGYDPTRGPVAVENSKNRFREISGSLVELKYVADANTLSYPTNVKPYDPKARAAQLSQPVGLVVSHVLSELSSGANSPFGGLSWGAIRDGGYSIRTTIDPRAQRALEASADATASGSALAGQPPNLQAAAVLVQPGTGQVLGYFGGSKGDGSDFAGVYNDEKGQPTGFGAHPSGATFQVHTLAAALKAGVALNSRWTWTPHDMPGRTGANQIRNSSTCAPDYNQATRKPASGACTLLDSTASSLNVPYYALTVSITPAKVLEMARAVGIDSMWTDDHQRQDLSRVKDLATLTPSKFDITVGLGQYPVTVLDQANAMATYAADGLRAQAHFVQSVSKNDAVVYGESLPTTNQPRVMQAPAIADLDYALRGRPAATMLTGVDSAAKTGSWEFGNRTDQNSDAWTVGWTGNLAMAVWIGDPTNKSPILDGKGAVIWGSGLPATIYRDVMNSVTEKVALPPKPFPPPAFVGTNNPPGAVPS